jgi:hypothetical protein
VEGGGWRSRYLARVVERRSDDLEQTRGTCLDTWPYHTLWREGGRGRGREEGVEMGVCRRCTGGVVHGRCESERERERERERGRESAAHLDRDEFGKVVEAPRDSGEGE